MAFLRSCRTVGHTAVSESVLPVGFGNSNIATGVLDTDNWDPIQFPTAKFYTQEGCLQGLRTIVVILVTTLTGACNSVQTCEELEYYELAEAGKRIEAPDDLNNLGTQKELQIPELSPRKVRDRSEGCLDWPPTLRISRPEETEDAT